MTTNPKAASPQNPKPRTLRRRSGSRSGFGTGLITTGSVMLGIAVAAYLFAPVLSPWGPMDIDPDANLAAPGGQHLLGTDSNGMDVWSRVLHSVPVDLGIAVASVFLAVVLGTAIGLFSGFIGRWVDDGVMRLIDILQAFPSFILALAVAALLGQTTSNLVIVLAIVNAPAYARLVRAEVRIVRELPYVEAARISGSSMMGILVRPAQQPCPRAGHCPAQLWLGDALARGLVLCGARRPRPQP